MASMIKPLILYHYVIKSLKVEHEFKHND